MNRTNKFIGLFFLTLALISCDTNFFSEGTVIDKTTQLPIDNVTINVNNLDSVYTDSLGKYRIDTMVYGYAGQLEILLSKQGYKTKHVNFKKETIENSNAIIEMEALDGPKEDYCIDQKRISQMHYFNKYFISIINILTLLFLIFRKRIRWRVLWIIGVLILNFTVYISFVDCNIMDFKLVNGPVFLSHYWLHPFSLKIVIPFATLCFWGIYLIRKGILIKPAK